MKGRFFLISTFAAGLLVAAVPAAQAEDAPENQPAEAETMAKEQDAAAKKIAARKAEDKEAQEQKTKEAVERQIERDKYKGLTLKLGDKQFIRFITWHQVWLRWTDPNPGTIIGGSLQRDTYFDIGLRRSRLLAFAQLNEFQIMTHFGINNQSFNNARKPQLFMHDVWTQYALFKNYLQIGFGLHYWHGISRLTNQSTLNFLTLDAPITNWPTIERTDQFARFLGIWIKGQVAGLDYRISLNKPFRTDRDPDPISEDNPNPNPMSEYLGETNTLSVAGYVEYQFLDKESDSLPYKVGTYIGSKTIFNLGFGFYYHPDSMQSLTPDLTRERTHDTLLVGVDLFADLPLGDRETAGALSTYLVFYNYDFGPDHIRNIGIMNVAEQTDPTRVSLNGAGNAYPSIGTGQHVYFQLGYLLPPSWFGGFEFMPYGAFQFSNMEALDDPMVLGEVGLNWFLQGHHAKITMAYRSRPIFNNIAPPGLDADIREDGRAGEFIVQTMIFL